MGGEVKTCLYNIDFLNGNDIDSFIISVQDNHVWRFYCMNDHDDVSPKLVCFSLSNFVKIMYFVFTPSKKLKLSDHMCIIYTGTDIHMWYDSFNFLEGTYYVHIA